MTFQHDTKKRGVYFLSHDRMFSQTVAFLRSFRVSNPELPLLLVPFADDVAAITALRSVYRFEVFDDSDTLADCDRISEMFHGRTLGHYRKLGCWSGPFNEFIYIDIDTLVLSDVSFAFGYLGDFGVVVSHSDLDDLRKWVWRRSIYRSGLLSSREIAFAANTGFIASKRGVLDLAVAGEIATQLEQLREHMVLASKEQSFLNYLIVRSGARFTSLRTIVQLSLMAGIGSDIPLEVWADSNGARLVRPDGSRQDGNGRVLLVHWAGYGPHDVWHRVRWRARALSHGHFSWRDMWQGMPCSDLWLHYRYGNVSVTDMSH